MQTDKTLGATRFEKEPLCLLVTLALLQPLTMLPCGNVGQHEPLQEPRGEEQREVVVWEVADGGIDIGPLLLREVDGAESSWPSQSNPRGRAPYKAGTPLVEDEPELDTPSASGLDVSDFSKAGHVTCIRARRRTYPGRTRHTCPGQTCH